MLNIILELSETDKGLFTEVFQTAVKHTQPASRKMRIMCMYDSFERQRKEAKKLIYTTLDKAQIIELLTDLFNYYNETDQYELRAKTRHLINELAS